MQLKEYWIPKIREIDEFQKLADAEQSEVDLLKQKVKQFPKEIVVNSATNVGLSRYESMLGLHKMATTDLRRTNILQNLNNSLPFTMVYLKNLLNSVIGKGDYWLTVDGYLLELGVISTKEELLEMLREDLRKKIPANMGTIVKVLESIDARYYTGFYIQTADVVTI